MSDHQGHEIEKRSGYPDRRPGEPPTPTVGPEGREPDEPDSDDD